MAMVTNSRRCAGNQLTTNTWDGENRLTKVAMSTGIANTFTYNADGQRVQKQNSSGTTNHVWDRQNILLETNAGNVIQVVYTLKPLTYGDLVSQSQSGTDSFYLFDVAGSATHITDLAGAIANTCVYDSWGNLLSTSGAVPGPFQFIGRLGYYTDTDWNGTYIRARSYSPPIGAFLTRDPLAARIGDVPVFSHYAYADNNPVNRVDPSGLQISEACKVKLTQFNNWYQQEMARGTAWTAALPACPCNLPTQTRTRYKWFLCFSWGYETYQKFVSPDASIWSDPVDPGQTFHPGGHLCIRTKSANSNGSGQQCCYDNQGRLITLGPGAGTPDYTQAGLSGSLIGVGHVWTDVTAYNVAVFLDNHCLQANFLATYYVELYIEARPPNNGNNCPNNP